jgi:hypothetical protein
LALGKYTVLSETKNIFSEDIDLATNQKIYESILFLHNCKKTFSRNTMTVALKRLSPYLTSNIYNLNSILEFVISPNEDTDHELINANLFKELGLKNLYFFHIFLMHTYSNERRLNM